MEGEPPLPLKTNALWFRIKYRFIDLIRLLIVQAYDQLKRKYQYKKGVFLLRKLSRLTFRIDSAKVKFLCKRKTLEMH
jgi:hypothetical protein